MEIHLKNRFESRALKGMELLNRASTIHPGAISLVPGCPNNGFLDLSDSKDCLDEYVAYRASNQGKSIQEIWKQLGQYSDTNGIIGELVSRHLKLDEGISINPRAIIITNGCQESILISLLGLFTPGEDVLLVEDPTYMGFVGAAGSLGLELCALTPEMNAAEAFEQAVVRLKAEGKRPRGIYLIPDFNNPLGESLDLETRKRILRIASEHDIIILEDNPYRNISFGSKKMPTLRAMDSGGTVIYLGTFSKSLAPGLRIGYIAFGGKDDKVDNLSLTRLTSIKNIVSIATSPLAQAMIGGMLLRTNCSLVSRNRTISDFYKNRRDKMLSSLQNAFSCSGFSGGEFQWSHPQGGFFISLTLPFEFGEKELQECATMHKVVVIPMSFFSLSGRFRNKVRLSFSNVSDTDIECGVIRFSEFVKSRVFQKGKSVVLEMESKGMSNA